MSERRRFRIVIDEEAGGEPLGVLREEAGDEVLEGMSLCLAIEVRPGDPDPAVVKGLLDLVETMLHKFTYERESDSFRESVLQVGGRAGRIAKNDPTLKRPDPDAGAEVVVEMKERSDAWDSCLTVKEILQWKASAPSVLPRWIANLEKTDD